jgi:hypothetical protein
MRKLLFLIATFIIISSFCAVQAASSFSDLDSTHWAYTVIMKSTNKGVIAGYPDGTFRPSRQVTRAEFAKLLVIAADLEEMSGAYYNDVGQDHWAYNYINMISNYMLPCGTNFRPDDPITREEVAYTIVNAVRLDNSTYKEATINRFYDKDQITPGMEKYIIIIADNEIMVGNQDGTFNPKGYLTRAEITQLLFNISKKFNIESDTIVDYPVAEDLVYNGLSQHINAGKGYTFQGNFRGKEPGEYTADVVLITGYRWVDGTKNNRQVTWRIVKATPKLIVEKSASVKEEKKKTISYKYDGDGTIDVQISSPEIANIELDSQKKTITITGITSGYATITIASSETAHYNSISDTISVEVTSKYAMN